MSVPTLRFAEFRDAGEWEENILGDVCDYWNGASHEGSVTENGCYFLISLNSIGIDGNLKLDMKRLSNTDHSLQKDDLVMVLSDVAHGNFLGLTDIIPDDHFVLNQRMAGLRLKKSDQANVRFLRTTINFHQKYFKQKGQGSSQLNLSKSSVTDFPVYLPCLNEQQKIADCLSSLDELIAAQTQKLDTLKAHKKGLMQQLFPAEGETVPKLRFSVFRDAGEWEETSMGKVLSIGSGKDYKHLSLGKIPVYGTGGYMLSVDDYLYDGESVCIGRKGTIDKPIFLSGKFWTVDTLFYTHSFKKCLPRFIYAYSQMINWKDFNEASGVPSLSKVTIEKIDIKIPGLPEQQKIADCLSSLDELIAAQTQKIATLKIHKKGLMQQLFPSADEVVE